MDLTTPTHTPTNTLDTENETPPNNLKSLSFTNAALKKHHHPQPPASAAAVVGYRECLKNHAASLGGHALDGCGEFMPMPSPTSKNPTDPTSLKCAACGCHRNFHRRDDDLAPAAITTLFPPLLPPPPHPPRRSSPSSSSPSPPPPPPPPSSYYSAPHMLLALSAAVPDNQPAPATPTGAKGENPSGRKRFRTRFSHDQKEKMFSFSEKLGWKMQKCDEGLVEEFCDEIGVGKGVLKVWMHNNKHTFAKREINSTTTNGDCNGRVLNFDNDGNKSSATTTTTTNNCSRHHHHHHHERNNGVHFLDSSDGSRSSA